MRDRPVVVTFHEPGSAEALDRWRRWSGTTEVEDLGTDVHGLHRYRLPSEELWSAYVRAKAPR